MPINSVQNGPSGTVVRPSQPTLPAAERPRAVYRRADGLFDLELRAGLDGELYALRGQGPPLDAVGLAELVRRTGGAGDDVRVVMAGGGRYAPVFAELAGLIGRDVLISPAGSEARHLGTANAADVAYVDAFVGKPAAWIVVQPPPMATDLPGWYDTDDGVIRPRTGIVTLPLPGGLTLATRADFVDRRAAAATLLAGPAELTTIGVGTRAGGFVLGDYAGGHQVVDGRQLAAALSSLPLYGTEVRMWLTWPADLDEQEVLHRNLAGFAETSGATVWAPAPESTVEVLDGCRDLGATARDGRPANWQAYPPSASERPRFRPDLDGRLTPADDVLLLASAGVPLISRQPARRPTGHDKIAPRPGLFPIELVVQPDGRWALTHTESGPHVPGRREFERILRSAGWQGEDVQLLTGYPVPAAETFRRYGANLAGGLRTDVWVLPPDTRLEVVDGRPRAVDHRGNPSNWERLTPRSAPSRWISENGMLAPAAPAHPSGPYPFVTQPAGDPPVPPPAYADPSGPCPVVPQPAGGVPARSADGPPSGGLPLDRWPSDLGPDDEPQPLADDSPDLGPAGPLPVGRPPRLTSARSKVRHGLYWLADRPTVNAEPVDLYVVCAAEPGRAAVEGLPTPHLFAVGLMRPPASSRLGRGENLLRMRVLEGGAVDLSSIDVHVPPTLRLLLADQGMSYVIPAGLLDRTRLLDGWIAHPGGGYAAREEFPGERRLILRFWGARHGVAGLPVDVPRWPKAADETAYALLPGPRVATEAGALVLLAEKPKVKAGHRLLRLRVPRRRAIDVRAAARQLAGLAEVRTSAAALHDQRIELVLPSRDYDKVSVVELLAPGKLGWRPVPGTGGRTLAEFFAR